MVYWSDVMQDDVYLISTDGWKTDFIYDEKKKEYECDLLPKQYVINRYFAKEKEEIERDVELFEQKVNGHLKKMGFIT